MTSAAGVQTTVAAGMVQETSSDAALQNLRQTLQTLTHELRQPLSAIESTAYYLSLVLERGDVHAREHAARLRELVDQTNWILSCALQLSDSTPLVLQPVDLNELLTEVVASRMSEHPRIAFDLADDLPPVKLDPRRGRVLLQNLLDMLGESARNSTCTLQVKTSASAETTGVVLEIRAAIPGLQTAASLGCGSSLCVEAAKQTVEAQGGEFQCIVDPLAGIRLRMVLR
jgi:K+-sensing histidine kinase KdpD